MRRITRSPRAAATGSRSRSCARPVEPAASLSACSSATRASTHAVPTSTCTSALGATPGPPGSALQLDVEPVALGQAPGVASVAPRGIAARSTPTRLAATRWPACARSTGSSCTSTERTRTSPPPGATTSRSPAAIVPDQSVPVTTVPIPWSVNARSIGRRAAPVGGARLDRRRGRVERPAQLVEAGARARRGLDHRGACERRPREQLLDVGAGELRGLAVDEVALGQRDHGRAHAEQLEDRDVLARLRHHAVVAGDDEQREVDAGRARDHGAHEALVPGHVDDRERAARRQREAAHSRARSRCRAPAPRAGGRCRRRSAPARAPSCRGRCGPRCRA